MYKNTLNSKLQVKIWPVLIPCIWSLRSSNDRNFKCLLCRPRSDVSANEHERSGHSSNKNDIHNGLQFHGNGITNYLNPHCESEIDERHLDNTLGLSCDDHGTSTSSASQDIPPSSKQERLSTLNPAYKLNKFFFFWAKVVLSFPCCNIFCNDS